MYQFSSLLTCLCLLCLVSCTMRTVPKPLEEILATMPEEISSMVDSTQFEIQILYTQIDRDKSNLPILKSHSYNLDQEKYFYPASTVKMPVAFLALQRINELKSVSPEIDRNSTLLFEAGTPPQSEMKVDSTSPTGYPNVALFVEKIFSVSDNNAYNRLYEFLGQDYINESLREKGIFTNSRIRTRVGISGFDTESNKFTNPFKIVDAQQGVLYEQDEYYALYDSFIPLKNVEKGVGYYDSELDSIIYDPFDMSEKNFISLVDLEMSLRRVMFPELYDDTERFDLSDDQYSYLYDIMPKTPLEFPFNLSHADDYYDSYVKFFINGDSEKDIPEYIKIFNKVGWAYGTLTDCSYIIDTKNKIEFLLTATILVNKNEIFNDGKYEYEKTGLPFLSKLGEAVYHYELKRKRTYSPNLSKYQ